jgi:energy-coupling factor transport system ATP-binding protein
MISDGNLIADGKPYDVLHDYGRLEANRLVPTSLLDLNLQLFNKTGRFLRAETLAHK